MDHRMFGYVSICGKLVISLNSNVMCSVLYSNACVCSWLLCLALSGCVYVLCICMWVWFTNSHNSMRRNIQMLTNSISHCGVMVVKVTVLLGPILVSNCVVGLSPC